jgi:hypothetical protein
VLLSMVVSGGQKDLALEVVVAAGHVELVLLLVLLRVMTSSQVGSCSGDTHEVAAVLQEFGVRLTLMLEGVQ